MIVDKLSNFKIYFQFIIIFHYSLRANDNINKNIKKNQKL